MKRHPDPRAQLRDWAGRLGVLAALVVLIPLGGCASTASPGGGPATLQLSGAGVTAGAVGTADSAAGGDVVANGPGLPPGFGGWVLAGTLPDGPDHAAVYRWSTDEASAAQVSQLAAALGVNGTPQRHPHGWELTGATGTLWVRDGGGVAWAYARADLAKCPPFGLDIDHAGLGSGVACAVAVPGGSTPPPGPDVATARATATTLLTALSVPGTVQVRVGSPSSTVTVDPPVAGQPTSGIATTVLVDASGLRAATGRLNLPRGGAVYPLRTAKAAFDALANGPRPMLMPYCGPLPEGVGAPESGSAGSGAAEPATPESRPASAGPAVSAPAPCPTPTPSKVTGARLGLMLEYDYSGQGQELLVPAWFFSVELAGGGSSEVPVLALDPAYVTVPTPTMRPVEPSVVQPGSPGTVLPVEPPVAPDSPTAGTMGG